MKKASRTAKGAKHVNRRINGTERKVIRNLIRIVYGNGSVNSLFELYVSKSKKGRQAFKKNLLGRM